MILPEPNTPGEIELIHDVITPIIVQIVNNDIMPSIPTCTFPEGQTPQDYGLAEGSFILGDGTLEGVVNENIMPDPLEVARMAILAALEDVNLPEGVDINQLIDDALLPAQGILVDQTITAEEVGKEIQLII